MTHNEGLNTEDVFLTLRNTISVSSSVLRENYFGDNKETKSQRTIVKQLKEVYGKEQITTEYHIGGYKGMRCDIDIANGSIGIELKVAEQLRTAAQVERLIGQVVYDMWRRYHQGNFIVVVVGKEKENDAPMQELAQIIQNLGARFLFKSVN